MIFFVEVASKRSYDKFSRMGLKLHLAFIFWTVECLFKVPVSGQGASERRTRGSAAAAEAEDGIGADIAASQELDPCAPGHYHLSNSKIPAH